MSLIAVPCEDPQSQARVPSRAEKITGSTQDFTMTTTLGGGLSLVSGVSSLTKCKRS